MSVKAFHLNPTRRLVSFLLNYCHVCDCVCVSQYEGIPQGQRLQYNANTGRMQYAPMLAQRSKIPVVIKEPSNFKEWGDINVRTAAMAGERTNDMHFAGDQDLWKDPRAQE